MKKLHFWVSVSEVARHYHVQHQNEVRDHENLIGSVPHRPHEDDANDSERDCPNESPLYLRRRDLIISSEPVDSYSDIIRRTILKKAYPNSNWSHCKPEN